jgi:hypothetical protein
MTNDDSFIWQWTFGSSLTIHDSESTFWLLCEGALSSGWILSIEREASFPKGSCQQGSHSPVALRSLCCSCRLYYELPVLIYWRACF